MKREILFKAKRVDNGEWAFGSLYVPNQLLRGVYISLDTTCFNFYPDLDDLDEDEKIDLSTQPPGISIGKFIEVHPQTVCQFTGLLDKNGNKIFEGDNITSDFHSKSVFSIVFDFGSFKLSEFSFSPSKNIIGGFEIIGNIHDKNTNDEL